MYISIKRFKPPDCLAGKRSLDCNRVVRSCECGMLMMWLHLKQLFYLLFFKKRRKKYNS
jgi:hypothetical protein